ncbi:MAG: replication initiation protein RepC [Litorimonas sp.]
MSIATTQRIHGDARDLYDPTRTESVRRPKAGDFLARKLVRAYAGLPDGVDHPAQMLHTLKEAFPRLGIGERALRLYDYLFSMTGPQDWHKDRLALIWPSNERIMSDLAIGDVSHLKKLMRQLRALGLIDYKDSPTRKRYGYRLADGTIDYARSYGIVLNSIAGLHADFKRLADEVKIHARFTRVIRSTVTAYRRERDDLLTAAADLMETESFEARRRIFDGLDDEIAESGRDYALKEAILERYRIALDTLIAELAHDALSPLPDFAVFDDAQLERMRSFKPKEPPTGGQGGPSNRNITEAFLPSSNRLSDKSSDAADAENRNPERPGDRSAGSDRDDGAQKAATFAGGRVAIPPQGGALQRRLDRIRQIEARADAEVPGPVERYAYTPAKVSLRQVKAALPPRVSVHIREDWGFYEVYDHVAEAASEVGLSVRLLDDARLLMGRDRASACAAAIIAKSEHIKRKDAYLRGMMEAYREGRLFVERSLHGIIAERRKRVPETRKLPGL